MTQCGPNLAHPLPLPAVQASLWPAPPTPLRVGHGAARGAAPFRPPPAWRAAFPPNGPTGRRRERREPNRALSGPYESFCTTAATAHSRESAQPRPGPGGPVCRHDRPATRRAASAKAQSSPHCVLRPPMQPNAHSSYCILPGDQPFVHIIYIFRLHIECWRAEYSHESHVPRPTKCPGVHKIHCTSISSSRSAVSPGDLCIKAMGAGTCCCAVLVGNSPSDPCSHHRQLSQDGCHWHNV
jgi:hypothetical protein